MSILSLDDKPCAYRISVKAMIKNPTGQILLIRENDGDGWEFPGGGLEHGESPQTGLARELKEEINVDIKSISHQPVGFWPINAGVAYRWYGFVLYEVVIDGAPTSGEESDEIKYFNPDDIKNLKLNPNTAPYFLAD